MPEGGFLPLASLTVDGLEIPASMIAGGEIDHDVSSGTVTVTFVNVRTVITAYTHQEAPDA